MPTAKKSTETREVTTTVIEDVVVLTLSIPEARALYAVTGAVTGDSCTEGSPRKYTDGVWRELGRMPAVSRTGTGDERITTQGTVRLDKGGRDFPF